MKCLRRLRPYSDRIALAVAVAIVVFVATTLTSRQSDQGDVQRDLAAAQVKIERTAVEAKKVADQLAAYQNEQSIVRVVAVDQRCEDVALDIRILRRAPRSLSAEKRANYRKCLEIRRDYLADLSPGQRAEYHRRSEEHR